MSDPFKEFVEEMARLAVPEDDTEENRRLREAAASESPMIENSFKQTLAWQTRPQ